MTGEPPLQRKQAPSWEPVFDITLKPWNSTGDFQDSDARIRPVLEALNVRLYYIFKDLQDFSRLANFLVQTKQKMRPRVYQELMITVQHRLLYLDINETDHLAEYLRLGMLAYITTVLLQIPGIKIRYSWIIDRVATVSREVQVVSPEERLLKSWASFTCVMCLFEPGDICGTKLLQMDDMGVQAWREAKERLKTVMWIDIIHDQPGEQAFERIGSLNPKDGITADEV